MMKMILTKNAQFKKLNNQRYLAKNRLKRNSKGGI